MESRFIATPSGKFHAMVGGQGRSVILIHGSSDINSWRVWEKNVGPLSQHFHVYALDLLGYGQSDRQDVERDTLLEAAGIVELMDAEQMPEANLVGLSWGGQIAQTIALQTPERVSRLVLADSAYDPSPEGLEDLKTIEAPTLVIWDQDDAVIPVSMGLQLTQALPRAEMVVLTAAQRDPDADPANKHWSQMSHSAAFNKQVIQFLSEKRK